MEYESSLENELVDVFSAVDVSLGTGSHTDTWYWWHSEGKIVSNHYQLDSGEVYLLITQRVTNLLQEGMLVII